MDFSNKTDAATIMEHFGGEAKGKSFLITGSNTGLGLATARHLLRAEGKVIMACRNLQKASEAKELLIQETSCKPEAISILIVDLGDLTTLKKAVESAKIENIDCFIANAGMQPEAYKETKQGYEMNWGVNHLGHFALFKLIQPTLEKSTYKRVVILSSSSHSGDVPHVQDCLNPKPTKADFQQFEYYGRSKLCNVLFGQELAMRNPSYDVAIVHPGAIMDSNLINLPIRDYIPRGVYSWIVWAIVSAYLYYKIGHNRDVKTIEQGCATTLLCSLADVESGNYYQDCHKSHAREDIEDTHRADLWKVSEEIIKNFI